MINIGYISIQGRQLVWLTLVLYPLQKMMTYAFLVVILGIRGTFAFMGATAMLPKSPCGAHLQLTPARLSGTSSRTSSRRHMRMALTNEESERALANMARAARKIGPNDRVVELKKPMGLILEEDERGNVYIVEVAPGGNASRNKDIYVGDMISFVSATFGEEVWSAKGVGLSRVQSAIKLRQGPLVKLVLETTKEGEAKRLRDAKRLQQIQEDKESAVEKRNRLLSELDDDTKKQKKKPWYGIF